LGGVTFCQIATRTFTITNTGTALLTVTSISYPTGFTGDWSGGGIAAGGSKTVTVTFQPTAAQSYGGLVTVGSNATNAAAVNAIGIAGVGLIPSAWTSVVTRISAGYNHSLFLKNDGIAWGTGSNWYGELGLGSAAYRKAPVPVLSNVAAISAGIQYSLFLRTDGTAWATGQNFSGRLGDGTTTSRNTPVQVLSGIAAISAGDYHSLFLKIDGTVWATGLNKDGQLGDGSTINRNTPVQVKGLSGVTAISAGAGYSLFLKTDGTVWALGINTNGQLGDGTVTNRSAPVQVKGLSGITAISAGYQHSLFLKTDGTVWATGNNGFGRLGDGTVTNRNTPVQILSGVAAISAGFQHSLFLKADGTVWAAGYNYYGQLGDSTTTIRNTPVQIMDGVAAISAGGNHSLFLKPDGSVLATGYNGWGQLGDNTTLDRSAPVTVLFTAESQPGSSVVLFGDMAFGQLAVGQSNTRTFTIKNLRSASLTVTSISYPINFSGNWSGGIIAAGAAQTVTVTFSPTAAQCYGGSITLSSNSGTGTLAASGSGMATSISAPAITLSGDLAFGALAVGKSATRTLTIANTGNAILTVTSISYPAGFTGNWSGGTIAAGESKAVTVTFKPVAAQIYGGSITVTSNATTGTPGLAASGTGGSSSTGTATVTRISAGSWHSLFLKTDGTVWATGFNGYGQFGDGSTSNQNRPVQVMSGVAAIYASESHSLFLKTDGTAWATGINDSGQLGDGTTTNHFTPVQIMSGIAAISAGKNHSLFLKTDGTVWASGFNGYGQLGDGTTAERDTPVQVMSGVTAISAGAYHSLFLKTDGTVWAAGLNNCGQLGDGTATEQDTPVQVMNGVAAISAGAYHSLFLKTDGSVWASGYNNFGGLGDGTTTEQDTPVQVVISGVAAISAGGGHSLFLKTDGSVWAAGSNYGGQLGIITDPLYQSTPVQVISGVASISAGGVHSLFLKADGTVWAAGDNQYGQLGDGTTTERDTPVSIVVAPPSGPVITLSGDLAFGQLTAGQSATRTLTIGNTGNAALTVMTIDYPPGFSGNWLGGTIAAGASKAVTVTFSPFIEQSYDGTVTVFSDAVSGTNTRGAYGVGIPPPEPLTLWFGVAAATRSPIVETNPALRYYAKDLPAGLKIDAITGAITGTITAKPGNYVVQFWTQNGTTKSYIVPQGFTVQPLPASFIGGFDGMLRDASGEPQGRAEATIGAQGAVTGKLVYRDGKTYALKGALAVADGGTSATATFRVALSKTSTFFVGVELQQTGEVWFSANPAEEALFVGPQLEGPGYRRGVFSTTTPAPWQGRYTGYFARLAGDAAAGPEGAGYALLTIDAKGLAQLKGKLADGTAITASLPTGTAGEATLFIQPYQRADSQLAGLLQWTRQNADSPYQVNTGTNGPLTWKKAPGAKDKGDRAGFGLLSLAPVIRFWTVPSLGQTLAVVTPGLNAAADLGLVLAGAGLDNSDLPGSGSANTYGLPAALSWITKDNILGAAEANPVKWTAKINPATGLVTGSFILRDETTTAGKTTVVSRTVALEGVCLQDADTEEGVLGGGFFLVPPVVAGGETHSGLFALTAEPFREKQLASPLKTGDVLKLTYAPNLGYNTSTWTVAKPDVINYAHALVPKGSASGQATCSLTEFGPDRSAYTAKDNKTNEETWISLRWESPTSGTFIGNSDRSGTFTFKTK
jgi:alpha-tubulin suppressor-like RCC1 family protein